MMIYKRVIPRDLFNEAKLLKCLGQLSLLIHDGALQNVTMLTDGDPFDIHLSEDGHLYVGNIDIRIHGSLTLMKVSYNSKGSYPLLCGWDVEVEVFTDDGAIHPRFREFVEAHKPNSNGKSKPRRTK